MKKIDLHMHTVASISDSHFEFSMSKLRQYVDECQLDAIAITNHNLFDLHQYYEITKAISIPVFPGIEINLEKCHLLLISDIKDAPNFAERGKLVTNLIENARSQITVEQLVDIYGDLERYLLIPHSGKSPSISEATLAKIPAHITAGEVDSPKKFVRASKSERSLTPVIFSDARISEELNELPTRGIFLDCGETTLAAIKSTLQHKSKVHLSAKDGNNLFQIFPDGQMLSTGLNVILGERSSGKTFTLERILNAQKSLGSLKYLRQFSLVQQDGDNYDQKFQQSVERQQSAITEKHLQGFKTVVDDILTVNVTSNERAIERYLDTLIRSAQAADQEDNFSRTALFNETAFTVSTEETLDDLIGSVRQLIENVDHREIITKHINVDALKALAIELITLLRTRTLTGNMKREVNTITQAVKSQLSVRSTAIQVADVDLFNVAIDAKKVDRFNQIARDLQSREIVYEETIQNFRVVASKKPFANATDVKSATKFKCSLSNAMNYYGNPYNYLQVLKEIEELPKAELYKLFTKIEFQILNQHGTPVSGGERSEFRLLQEIQDAQNFDMLLVDEPESSFDNRFLWSDVNSLLRDISKTMPVVVVTHNNTVGASIGADYLIYAQKQVTPQGITYKLYSGHPTSKLLRCPEGSEMRCHDGFLGALEAGQAAYIERRMHYEALAN